MEKEILLNNGVKIPTPGFGTFLTPDGATCVEAVKAAIAARLHPHRHCCYL